MRYKGTGQKQSGCWMYCSIRFLKIILERSVMPNSPQWICSCPLTDKKSKQSFRYFAPGRLFMYVLFTLSRGWITSDENTKSSSKSKGFRHIVSISTHQPPNLYNIVNRN